MMRHTEGDVVLLRPTGAQPLGPREELIAAEVVAAQAEAGARGLAPSESQQATMRGHLVAQAWVGPSANASPRQRRSRHVRDALRILDARIAHLEQLDVDLAEAEATPTGWTPRHLRALAELRWCEYVLRYGCEPEPSTSALEPSDCPGAT